MIHTPPRMMITDAADRPVLWTWRHMLAVTRPEWQAQHERTRTMDDKVTLIVVSLAVLIPVYFFARRALRAWLGRLFGSCMLGDDYLPGRWER